MGGSLLDEVHSEAEGLCVKGAERGEIRTSERRSIIAICRRGSTNLICQGGGIESLSMIRRRGLRRAICDYLNSHCRSKCIEFRATLEMGKKKSKTSTL
jgi:hypothetical protein